MAVQQASGMLEVYGNPAGTVYFDQGQIAFARASWIPDLSARLLGALRPSAESRDLLVDGDRPDRDICTMLVQQKDLTRAELQKILRSVVVDAVIVLTMPADEDSFVSDIRFAPSGPHWASAFSRLHVDSVRMEAASRAERVARQQLARTTPVQLRDLSRPSAVLSRQQWAVACMIGGGLSAQDLAWQCGLALYEAIEYVGDLIRAGMCVTSVAEASGPAAEQAGQLARWFGTAELEPDAPGGASGPAIPAPPGARSEPEARPPAPQADLEADRDPEPAAAWAEADRDPELAVPRAEPDLIPRQPCGLPELPQRRPGAQMAQARHAMSAEFRTAAADPPRSSEFTAAPPELLHRVLDGLRRIS
jgi:DNA-binding NarL/FixJ family response regulator